MNEEEKIKEWSPLVHFICEKEYKKLPRDQVHYDEIYSAGLFGLLLAIRGEDKTKKVKFKTWAYTKISFAIKDYLREIDPLSREYRKKLNRGENIPVMTSYGLESESSWERYYDQKQYCDLQEMMQECLTELNDKELYVITAHYMLGSNYHDIALGVENAIKSNTVPRHFGFKNNNTVGYLVRKTLFKLSMMLSERLYPPKKHETNLKNCNT